MSARHTGFERIPGTELDMLLLSTAFERNGDRLPVLDEVTLRVQPGTLVAVLGPRGCGKSTLLRLVAGLEQASSGTILLDGEAAAAVPHLVLSREPKLSPSKTVHAQVAATLDLRRGPKEATRDAPADAPRDTPRDTASQADQALRLLGLTRFAGAGPRELTAGTAQRVSLATALVSDPRLLLLDDPFARLDPITRAAIQGDLVSLWQRTGFTALLATSDVDEALAVASRIIVLGARPASIVLDLTVECPFPRRAADPGVAGARRAVLQALDDSSAGRAPSRDPGAPARPANPTRMVWPADEPAPQRAA